MFSFKKATSKIDLLKGNPASYAHKTGNVWENPKVLEVNLIKESANVEFDWKRNFSRLGISALIALFFIVEIYFSLSWWEKEENKRADALAADLQQVNQDIKLVKTQADEFLTFKDKLTALKPLLDNHIYWTNFFSWLERHTLNSVTFGGFSGNTSGVYSLQAETKNFSDISYQVKAFLDAPETLEAEVLSGQSSQSKDKDGRVKSGAVTFGIDFKIKPEIFKK
ncbi:MAG: hypothetical protein WC441_00700 [Patescibacteria group bacterium]